MKRKERTRIHFVIIPLLGLSLLAVILLPRANNAGSLPAEEISGTLHEETVNMDEQKHEAPESREPMFISVFKFIVNCNPFKKETQL